MPPPCFQFQFPCKRRSAGLTVRRDAAKKTDPAWVFLRIVRPNQGFRYLIHSFRRRLEFQSLFCRRPKFIMAKPILLSVDDDSDVLRAIERDLRSHYGAEYRVIGRDSPAGVLHLLKQL